MKALRTNRHEDLRSLEKVTYPLGQTWTTHLFDRSETSKRIENLGEITSQEHRSVTRGGVWLWTLAQHGQPMVRRRISIPLPGGAPDIYGQETPFGGFKLWLGLAYTNDSVTAWGYCSWPVLSYVPPAPRPYLR